jgi:hypothetical protein
MSVFEKIEISLDNACDKISHKISNIDWNKIGNSIKSCFVNIFDIVELCRKPNVHQTNVNNLEKSISLQEIVIDDMKNNNQNDVKLNKQTEKTIQEPIEEKTQESIEEPIEELIEELIEDLNEEPFEEIKEENKEEIKEEIKEENKEEIKEPEINPQENELRQRKVRSDDEWDFVEEHPTEVSTTSELP